MWLYASLLSSSSSYASSCPLLVLKLVLLAVGLLPLHVTARFLCEGGHICSLPRDCCTQGCCPAYQGGPRPLPPPSEHVLNLFFISHWFFWCVVVAIILAILCAYSLWKKRRTLCGWGFNEHHTQSEGDSAGSCYAPPQYSRCNSFHHPPPPYTEVTSKPDLYPLVFTCNSDNGKGNGNSSSSYLMVQYFRNYIVRPAGSLSAASTVDSLSSSFICNANEANTMVPPPYSRAASPELGLHHYLAHAHGHGTRNADHPGALQLPLGPPPLPAAHQYGLPRSASQLVEPDMYLPRQTGAIQSQSRAHAQAQAQAQAQHYATVALGSGTGGGGAAMYSTRLHGSHEEGVSGLVSGTGAGVGYLQSQSDQHFRYMANSSSSLSDIFVNNSCVAGLGGAAGAGMAHGGGPSIDSVAATQAASLCSLAVGGGGGTPVIFSNGCIQPNPLHSLENCCQHSSMPVGMGDRDPTSGLGPVGTASTASGVSSLANIGTPVSPPQATSPTGEVREILDQIRQLQAGVSYEHLLLSGTGTGAKPRLQHTLSTPSSSQAPQPTAMTTSASGSSAVYASASGKSKKLFGSNKAPPPPNKALYIPMAAMGPGMGMSTGTAQRCLLKSPVSSVVSGASFFVNRGRVARKGWITRSAPTTPGSALPPNRLGDDSPLLLNEHDEDTIDDDNEDLDIETETETEAEAQDHRRLAHRQPHRHHRHGQRRRNGQIE
ncbi:uncharacterized protein [Drosophila pseudoobscura]|uniref:WW domain binding protein VOPP1 n=1 Tax=Drosophila pseudoobscura pseudoobscura TaxID=46245 RepID=A0A6I8V073_DROPS|nr:uncharacterized protein LOC6901005 isoform X1 [Drosophila pseudoobscura]XP_033237654.1 uncharacterized protein LOC6901005 isoform X1 [Drosophila pseudoobscura]XP_033237655.1 uncharacterized protein LOC6901005 isoform X1 [Drosophila pseudoobscura]